uniref:ADF-H domain-containing protein n=1 Tax=Palpitomonas bilix TaxID=652834 RepID=A0A7S3D584_9EUKA|eukprot:CAMPEP_0113884424 /NCGR_PEP_ID=MMETSP0780_2-20120614/10258_1 /TAXON_ID=652834 /ORGANISM="Palpitomonas bilix" /LENGTH=150 /DNA_ID=CAMNT_0000872059 /DNA_START=74 /DNA_END=526 /DNA_ORIENTATION=+ /assembly_acc=CAM_ASM_000599
MAQRTPEGMAVDVAVDEEVLAVWKKFRTKQKTTSAMIMKLNKEGSKIVLDELMEDTTCEDVAEELPESVPRYLIFSYRLERDDDVGRITFPLAFVYYMPENCNDRQRMLYSRPTKLLSDTLGLSKIFSCVDAEDLTSEWLQKEILSTKTR